MKLILYSIDWEYPSKKSIPRPDYWDLEDKNQLLMLYKSVADGIYLELRVKGESQKAIDVFRGIVKGGGSGQEVKLTNEEKEKLWLYKEGDECYKQGRDSYFFINPKPQPEKFKNK